MKKTNIIDEIELNLSLGKVIRKIRQKLFLPQKDIASKIGVSLQQLAKYEMGVNRISAAKLIHLAAILNVDIKDVVKETLTGEEVASNLNNNNFNEKRLHNLLSRELNKVGKKLPVHVLRCLITLATNQSSDRDWYQEPSDHVNDDTNDNVDIGDIGDIDHNMNGEAA